MKRNRINSKIERCMEDVQNRIEFGIGRHGVSPEKRMEMMLSRHGDMNQALDRLCYAESLLSCLPETETKIYYANEIRKLHNRAYKMGAENFMILAANAAYGHNENECLACIGVSRKYSEKAGLYGRSCPADPAEEQHLMDMASGKAMPGRNLPAEELERIMQFLAENILNKIYPADPLNNMPVFLRIFISKNEVRNDEKGGA